jgi:hypothetical protein
MCSRESSSDIRHYDACNAAKEGEAILNYRPAVKPINLKLLLNVWKVSNARGTRGGNKYDVKHDLLRNACGSCVGIGIVESQQS